jgi:hypothetical protein
MKFIIVFPFASKSIINTIFDLNSELVRERLFDRNEQRTRGHDEGQTKKTRSQ